MTDKPETTDFPEGCADARRLANFMSRHIVGEAFAAADETCGLCIQAVERFQAAVMAAERERCARVAEEYRFGFECVGGEWAASQLIARKIRSGE